MDNLNGIIYLTFDSDITSPVISSVQRLITGETTLVGKLREAARQVGSTLLNIPPAGQNYHFRCDKGHVFNLDAQRMLSYYPCPICVPVETARTRKSFFTLFDREGYTLHDRYVNTKKPVSVSCPQGHRYQVRSANFILGNRCGTCRMKNTTTIDEDLTCQQRFLKFLETQKYHLIEPYRNSSTKVKVECCQGHLWSVAPKRFYAGNEMQCPKCTHNSREQSREVFLQSVEDEGYTLLSPYVNGKVHVQLRCPSGHNFYISPHYFRRQARCYRCQGLPARQADVFMAKLHPGHWVHQSPGAADRQVQPRSPVTDLPE